jgi:DNA-directed RNA polymerase subunit M/transcription elongation factor TFIIS
MPKQGWRDSLAVEKKGIRCPKCGSRLYEVLQTFLAGLDDAIYYRCRECGHEWRLKDFQDISIKQLGAAVKEE